MSLKNSSFYKNISKDGNSLLEQRALLVAEDAEYSQREIVDRIKKDIRSIDSKISKLEDLGRTSNDSLQVLDGEYDSSAWTAELQTLGEQRVVLEVKLKVAQANYDKYFGIVESEA